MSDDVRITIIDGRGKAKWSAAGSAVRLTLIPLVFFGPGVAVGSAAMQWAGFILLFAVIAGMLAMWERKRLTIDEARAMLDEMEAGE